MTEINNRVIVISSACGDPSRNVIGLGSRETSCMWWYSVQVAEFMAAQSMAGTLQMLTGLAPSQAYLPS